MPFPQTPRSLRDEVMFDLDEQLDELRALAEDAKAIVRLASHIQRRASNVNRLRAQAVANQREAQTIESHAAMSWDGIERRRQAVAA